MQGNKEPLSVYKFLLSEGINLEATSLICYIEGRMCQPDLAYLFIKYGQKKVQEFKDSNSPIK